MVTGNIWKQKVSWIIFGIIFFSWLFPWKGNEIYEAGTTCLLGIGMRGVGPPQGTNQPHRIHGRIAYESLHGNHKNQLRCKGKYTSPMDGEGSYATSFFLFVFWLFGIWMLPIICHSFRWLLQKADAQRRILKAETALADVQVYQVKRDVFWLCFVFGPPHPEWDCAPRCGEFSVLQVANLRSNLWHDGRDERNPPKSCWNVGIANVMTRIQFKILASVEQHPARGVRKLYAYIRIQLSYTSNCCQPA